MSDQPQSITDLLHRHRDNTGDSLAQIAHKTGLSKALIGQLLHGTKRRVLHGDTVDKLAKGLRLPLSVVQSAAMVSAGIATDDVGPDQRLALLNADLACLSASDLEVVEVIVSALVTHRG